MHSLQDRQNQATKQHTENQSPVTPTTRLMVGFYSSIQNNTFNVNTSSLMGSCPLSLRIWISWMRNLHCSQQRSLCCACRNTRVASTAYKCNRIVKLILSSPLFLLCLRACNLKSLWFSGELQAIHWCCFRSRVVGVTSLTRLSPIRTCNDLPYSSHPTDIFLLEKGANFIAAHIIGKQPYIRSEITLQSTTCIMI